MVRKFIIYVENVKSFLLVYNGSKFNIDFHFTDN